MPRNRPPTMTTTEPTCSFCIRSAASARQSSPSTRTTQGRKIDLTFIVLSLLTTELRVRFTLRRGPGPTQGRTALRGWVGRPASGARLVPARKGIPGQQAVAAHASSCSFRAADPLPTGPCGGGCTLGVLPLEDEFVVLGGAERGDAGAKICTSRQPSRPYS